MFIFRNMSWCDAQYRTDTPYKDATWKPIPEFIRVRLLKTYFSNRHAHHKDDSKHVCGLKDFQSE
jgi:hypothetical protein